MSFLSLLPVRLSRLCLTWNLKWKACVLNTASIDVCLCVGIQDNGLFPSSTGYLSQRMLQVPSCYIRTKTSWLLADAPFSEKTHADTCLLSVTCLFRVLDPIPEFLKNMQIHFKFHKAYVIHCPFRDWFQSCYFIKPILPAISKPMFFQNCLMLYPHTVCWNKR